jgi:hypothetical protein
MSLRNVAAALLLSLPVPALAGGLGVNANSGVHFDRVYSYSVDDAGNFEQLAPETQILPDQQFSIEGVLGDRDNRILGVFSFGYLVDSGQMPPQRGDAYNVRRDPRSVGTLSAGLQFGFLGQPDKLQAIAVGSIGSGFLTTDQTEFAFGNAGVGGSWTLARHIQVAATATAGTRYRKRFYPTGNVGLSARYLFD